MSLEKAKAIFVELVAHVPPEQWDARLAELAGTDQELRRQVSRILAAHRDAGSFLESPAAGLGATMDEPPVGGYGPPESVGSMIGPYKLLEQIGEGGMGAVWMAQQTEPVKRLVAVKLIKAGMDSKAVIARFEAERQALALMEHPNIARVLDGGTTNAGRPYFVMDLVKGVPITKYCDEHRLTPRQRLELFIPVCQAIQHAHQKGIIHRDLKPSNVLIALYDGKPVPKVIDFGVAKAAGQQLTDKTLVTGFGAIVGTLEYMSPEQAEVNQLDIDTRSDIYSLGVLLYELLAGSPPFSRMDLERAGMLEMLRVIREQEPSKPSTKLSSSDALPTLSANRATEPAKLTKLVRGELDWIVMKALEKDRNRRYESANGFAMDVQRYLADEPVLACPPSPGYRLRKFARRNWRVLTALAAAAASMLLGLSVVVVLLVIHAAQMKEEQQRTRKEYDRAEIALQRADQNLALAMEALDDVYMKDVEDRVLRDKRMTQAERDSVAKGVQFYERFARQNSEHASLEQVTAKARRRAGSLRMQLGDWKDAESQFTTAVPVFEKLASASPDIAELRQELASCFDLASEARIRARMDEKAEPSCRQAVAVWQKLVSDFPKEPNYRVGFAASLLRLGQVLARLNGPGGREEAEKFMRQTVELYTALAAQYPENVGYRGELAWAHHELNHYVLTPSGRRLEAVENQQQAIAICEARAAASPDNLYFRQALGDHYCDLGHRLNEAGQVLQAEEAFNQALRTYEKLVAESPKSDYQLRVGWTHVYLGNLFRDRKLLQNAEKAYRKALDVYAKLISDSTSHRSIMWRMPALAQALTNLLRLTGRGVEADAVLRQAADSCLAALGHYDNWPADRNLPGDPWDFATSYLTLGQVLNELGRFPEAAEAYHRALGLSGKVYSDFNNADLGHWQWTVRRHIELGRILAAAGRREESDFTFRKAAEVQRRQETAFGGKPQYRQQLAEGQAIAADLWHEAGRTEEALQLLSDSLKRGFLTPEYVNNSLAWPLVAKPVHDPRDADWAVDVAKLAVERAPDNGSIVNTLGTAYYRAGNWKAAIATLKDGQRLGSGQHFGHDAFFAAMAHGKLGERETARKWFTAAVGWMEHNAPKSEELLLFRAEAAKLLGLPERGEPPTGKTPDDRELWTLIIELNPEAAWAYLARAQILQRDGELQNAHADYSKALDLHTKAIDQNPNFPARWAGRAIAYAELGEWDKATSDWQKAVALWNEMVASGAGPLVWYQLALARLGAKDQAGYRSVCSEIVKRFADRDHLPYSDFALWGCAVADGAVSDYAPLLAWAEKRAASDVTYRVAFGAVLYRAGRFDAAARQLDEAQAVLERSSDTRTSVAYPWYLLAMSHHRLGHSQEAGQWLAKANRVAEQAQRKSANIPPMTWNRRLTLELLRREAEATLKETSTPPQPSKKAD